MEGLRDKTSRLEGGAATNINLMSTFFECSSHDLGQPQTEGGGREGGREGGIPYRAGGGVKVTDLSVLLSPLRKELSPGHYLLVVQRKMRQHLCQTGGSGITNTVIGQGQRQEGAV